MFGVKRGEFITLLGGSAVAWPLAARAQQADRMRRIAVWDNHAEDDSLTKAELASFREALVRLGWVEGHTIHIDYRFTGGSPDQYPVLAKELVALKPDVIVVQSTPATAALQRVTNVIPVVFVSVSDPIGSGFVANLAQPGGNLTGLMQYEVGITGKWLAMLKEIAPRLARVAAVANPHTGPYDYFLRSAKAAASQLAIEVVPSPVNNVADIGRSMESFARVADSGLLMVPDSFTITHRDLVITLAARYRLPAVYSWRFFVTAGGLMSYGIDIVDSFKQAAPYVDRILRGARPADLPVQAPTKYETVVNLKTAKALGLEVPPSLLVRADEVIE